MGPAQPRQPQERQSLWGWCPSHSPSLDPSRLHSLHLMCQDLPDHPSLQKPLSEPEHQGDTVSRRGALIAPLRPPPLLGAYAEGALGGRTVWSSEWVSGSLPTLLPPPILLCQEACPADGRDGMLRGVGIKHPASSPPRPMDDVWQEPGEKDTWATVTLLGCRWARALQDHGGPPAHVTSTDIPVPA